MSWRPKTVLGEQGLFWKELHFHQRGVNAEPLEWYLGLIAEVKAGLWWFSWVLLWLSSSSGPRVIHDLPLTSPQDLDWVAMRSRMSHLDPPLLQSAGEGLGRFGEGETSLAPVVSNSPASSKLPTSISQSKQRGQDKKILTFLYSDFKGGKKKACGILFHFYSKGLVEAKSIFIFVFSLWLKQRLCV